MSDDRAKLDDGEGRWSPRHDIRLVRGSDADIRRVGAPGLIVKGEARALAKQGDRMIGKAELEIRYCVT